MWQRNFNLLPFRAISALVQTARSLPDKSGVGSGAAVKEPPDWVCPGHLGSANPGASDVVPETYSTSEFKVAA